MKNYEKLWEAMRSYEKQRKIMNPQWITCSASPQTDSPFQLLIEICFIPEEKYVVLWNIKYLVPCGWIYLWRKYSIYSILKHLARHCPRALASYKPVWLFELFLYEVNQICRSSFEVAARREALRYVITSISTSTWFLFESASNCNEILEVTYWGNGLPTSKVKIP